MACLCSVSTSPSPFSTPTSGKCVVAGKQKKQMVAIAWRQQTATSLIGQQAWRTWTVGHRNEGNGAGVICKGGDGESALGYNDDEVAASAEGDGDLGTPNKSGCDVGFSSDRCGASLRGPTACSSFLSSTQENRTMAQSCCAENLSAGTPWRFSPLGGLSPGWQRGSAEKRRLRSDRIAVGFHLGARSRSPKQDRRRTSPAAAILDPHSLVLLSEAAHLSDFPVRIELDPTREIITTHVVSELSEQAIKTFFLILSLLFTWGCCVFGSMNDKFYDSDYYRKAGGDGTGHWLYDKQAEEEAAAREEMWSEDLLKEIEEKAEEVRKAEEEESKKKGKEVELV